MEQEERDAYVKRYGEDALRRRDIHARFAVFASERLQGPQGEVWGELLETFMKLETLPLAFILNFKKLLPKLGMFPIWRTVHLVPEVDPRMTIQVAIKMAGMYVGRWAEEILRNPAFPMTTKETKVKLAKVTVAELGFSDGATLHEIYVRAQEHNLGLCFAEVGPQLRLQYEDQSRDEWLLVGMEPIVGSDGRSYVFSVVHDGNGRRELGVCSVGGSATFSGARSWLFVVR